MVQHVYERIQSLQENPYQPQVKKLRADPGYRLRIGDYRVFFDIDAKKRIVKVFAVLHRREAYR